WAASVGSHWRVRREDLLSERPAVGLHKRKRRTRGYEGVCGGHPLKQFEPVVGKEKESLVLFDRSAYPSAELVLDVFRPRGKDGHCRVCLIIVDRCAVVPVVEKVIGVQRGIAVLPVAHAVKSVGSRLLVCRDERSEERRVGKECRSRGWGWQ